MRPERIENSRKGNQNFRIALRRNIENIGRKRRWQTCMGAFQIVA
jgi:hypothetical protein